MSSTKRSSEVVLFLGAGASIKAGVPDTYSFVDKFRQSVTNNDKKVVVDKIITLLEEWKGSKIDVELLLETLTKLDSKEQEPLLKFFEGGRFILSGYSEKSPIIEDLKDFIKSRAIVMPEKIKYLEPLLGFVEESRPLDIISVNYDTCIEQFCNIYKLDYQDGFDVHWNPKTFEEENADIRLYKLHGSVMWYRSDRGGYMKLPVMAERSGVQLITGERAENLMLYPMQKWEYAEPLLELLVEIKHRLESENCRFLIVVGYSFRDEHITRILWDVARKNRNLHFMIVDPKAYQIYLEKLRYYDSKTGIPSSLYGRVVCLPYRFEEVFPYLKDHYLKNLREGLTCEATQRRSKLKGEKANWIACLRVLINAEHTDKVEEILKKVEPSELDRDWQISLELPLKMFLNLIANDQRESAGKYLESLNRKLSLMFIKRLNIEVMRDPPIIEINLNYIRTDSGASCVGAAMIRNVIEDLYQYIETRSRMITQEERISRLRQRFKGIRNYLEPFGERGIEFERYIQLREEKIEDVESLKQKFQEYKKEYSDELHYELSNPIRKIEKQILEDLLSNEE